MSTMHAAIRRQAAPVVPFTVLGDRTRHTGLRVSPEVGSKEPWCEPMEVCPALRNLGILHLGNVSAVSPYRFERESIPAPIFLACLGGEGRVGVDSRFFDLGAGSAVFLPRGCRASYYSHSREAWKLAWLCFSEDDPLQIHSGGPLRSFEGGALSHAIHALVEDWMQHHDLLSATRLLESIGHLVKRYAACRQGSALFFSAWQKIELSLEAPWILEDMASLASCSLEQFRRICQKEFRMSPMRHLTALRIKRASVLLRETDQTVETIGTQLGYSDGYTFSHAFKRRVGVSPAGFRRSGPAGDI